MTSAGYLKLSHWGEADVKQMEKEEWAGDLDACYGGKNCLLTQSARSWLGGGKSPKWAVVNR